MGEEEKKLYLRDQVMIKEQASRIDYIKSNPQWELSLQIHKYINVP